MAANRVRSTGAGAAVAVALFAMGSVAHVAVAADTATLVLRGVVPQSARITIAPGPLTEHVAGGNFALAPGGARSGGIVAHIEETANQGYDLMLLRTPDNEPAYDLRYRGDPVRFNGERAVLAAAPVAAHTVSASEGALWLRSGGGDPVDSRITLVVRAR
ncbi:MAG: hypothetical protein O2905_06110 [Proteobacteria bacterium]|nr:hypothetical protein [Pseudomonadota bacterium]